MGSAVTGTPNPSVYINPWSARLGQRIAARAVDSMLALGCVALVVIVGPHGRPLAQDLLIVTLVTTLESLTISRRGATVGMRVVDIRIAVIGSPRNPDLLTAVRRGVPVALTYALLLPATPLVVAMPIALVTSIALSPLQRAFHDRLSGTVVVQSGAPAMITTADLSTWWQPGRATVMSPWGRVPDLFERRRARAHRIDGAWWLAGLILATAIVSAAADGVKSMWLWATLAWLIAVTIDETRHIAGTGATPGHEHFGFRVVDIGTGEPPTTARAFVRAAVVAPLLYIPPLQLIGALWVHASSLHRGPHDLLAHTIVVEPGYRPHTFVAPPPRFTAFSYAASPVPNPVDHLPPPPFAPGPF